MQDTIVILEEGNQPYPQCPKCDMFVSHKSINGRNLVTDLLPKGKGMEAEPTYG